jgi:peptidoglycan-N-acetylglucosamine deacetylase
MATQPPTNKGLVLALIGVLIVASLIIWGLKSSEQPKSEEKAPEVTVAAWPSKAVKKETITDKSKTYEISAEYPVTGRDDITDKVRGFVEESIATFKKDTAGIEEGFRAATLDITYDEESNEVADNYIFHIYSDTGGAHGIEVTRTFSFDESGNLIELNDLFTNEDKGLQLVSQYVKTDLMKREFADSEWISEGAAPTDENYHSYTVSKKGLTVFFDPYQVAAYAAGPQTVDVPVSAFKAYANTKLFK